MQVEYNTDTTHGTRRWVRRLMAIPLVPPIRVQGVYQRIVAQVPNIQQAAAMHHLTHMLTRIMSYSHRYMERFWHRE